MTDIDATSVEFDPLVVEALRGLYTLMKWPAPSPDFDVWTFDELCALYFRVEHHIDAVPNGTTPEFLLSYIRAHIHDYLDDEFA